MDTPLLHVEGLKVVFPADRHQKNHLCAVKDLNLTLNSGETVAIVGESGSGKTVSCLAFTRLVEHYGGCIRAGKIYFRGSSVLDMKAEDLLEMRKRNVSYIFQDPVRSLSEHLSVEKHFEARFHSAGIKDKAIRRKRMYEALSAVKLQPTKRLLNASARELSGGMAQRLMIAIALLFEPELLIADEPSTALDLDTQAELVQMLSDICAKREMAMILVTHDIALAAHSSRRILVMKDGEILERGSTIEILSAPAHEYTRRLLASVPVLRHNSNIERNSSSHESPVLQIQKLNVCYDESFHAVKNIDLEIFPNEISGIIGESGSGKSSLLRAITGITASTGRILYKGTDVHVMTARQRHAMRTHLQMIFQNPYRSFQPASKLFESIREPLHRLRIASPAEQQQIIKEICEHVGLALVPLERLPSQYSGGQLQRASIARSLSPQPEILFADEAISSLDVVIQAQVLKLLKKIRNTSGISIVFVTHDLAAAAQICDRLIVMESGCIVEEGSCSDILDSPQHPYTKKLVAAADFFDPGRFLNAKK